MLLALDIGNTEATVAVYRGDDLVAMGRLTTNAPRTPDEWAAATAALLAQHEVPARAIRACALASVAPPVTHDLMEGLRLLTGVEVLAIDAGSPLPVLLDVDEPKAVGADRIVNALSASLTYRADTVVVDFGTATTFDCVTRDGRFLGGAIMPGIRTSAEYLTRKTAKLPAVDMAAPPRAIGRATVEAIQAGVLFGAADAVDGMIDRVRREWPGGVVPRVVATGGLAAMVAPLSRTIELVDRDLTLRGIRFAARHLGLDW